MITGTITGNSSLTNQTGPIADILTNTGSADGKVHYEITAAGPAPGNCVSGPKAIDITVSAGAAVAEAGNNQILCNSTQTKLSGNNPSNGSGEWTQIGGNAVVISTPSAYNSDITGLKTNEVYKFLWTIKSSNSTCGSTRDSVVITVRPVTTQSNAGRDSSFCSTTVNSYILQGNSPAGNEKGKWTIVSSSFSPSPTFEDDTNPVSKLMGLKAGTVELKWEITSDATGCTPSSDLVKLTIGASTEAAIAGNDQILCNVIAGTLNASAVNNPSSGLWNSLSVSVVEQINNPNSKVNNLQIGDNKFVWTVTNSLCPNANKDTVNLIVRQSITKASAGKDTIFCGSTGTLNYKLQANAAGSF